ncbi:hypothetical protein MLD38_000567 [Melastoma candidum]|uniref:Uncharacterized protein n=1 Tax=Melastoma candidum TaxID=119954 RepID=A0ACB9SEF9_9MYRT|nr:hypothetical protein MLD38_000567 [Melastoma candidum]
MEEAPSCVRNRLADVHAENTANPILIEQQYFPNNKCDPKEVSLVVICNISYGNIRGSSSSRVAVSLHCSSTVPCLGIKLQDINLSYVGEEGGVTLSVPTPSVHSRANKIRPHASQARPVNPLQFHLNMRSGKHVPVEMTPCGSFLQDVSLVAIHYVKYKNITGSSSSHVAVNLQCSPVVPCHGITLQDIDLSYYRGEGDTTSSCNNVFGSLLANSIRLHV